MKYLNKFSSLLTLIILSGVIIHIANTHSDWREKQIIRADTIYYYAYLPATFIKKDLKLSFMDDADFDKSLIYYRWPGKRADGRRIIKTTMGMAILWAPFAGVAHVYSLLNDEIRADGYSEPYHHLITWAAIVYSILGLVFFRVIMKRFFNDVITSILMVSVLIGSNFLHYATHETGMTHAYSFMLVTLFLLLYLRWNEQRNWKISLGLGLILGLIVLVRPNNGLIILFPLLHGVTNWRSFKSRLMFLFAQNYKYIFIIGFVSFLVLVPQLLYWKWMSGQFLYSSYGKEGFYFNNPHVLEGLLSYRKGWLVYSPIFIFSILGFLTLRKKGGLLLPILLFFVLNLYVTFSWWSWWYGGGFGARTLIDSYTLIMIPFGYMLQWLFAKKWTYFVMIPLLSTFVYVSWYQNWQYRKGVIHHSMMCKKTYWGVFMCEKFYPRFFNDLEPFDDDKAVNGEDEYDFNPF